VLAFHLTKEAGRENEMAIIFGAKLPAPGGFQVLPSLNLTPATLSRVSG
jgi:hypothetical protein